MQNIGKKAEIPDVAWTNNPMLQPTPHDPNWKGHEDGGINLDHYLYGVPKDYIKVKGKYIEAHPCRMIITKAAPAATLTTEKSANWMRQKSLQGFDGRVPHSFS